MEQATKKYLETKFSEIQKRFDALDKILAGLVPSETAVFPTPARMPERPQAIENVEPTRRLQKSWPIPSQYRVETQRVDASPSVHETQRAIASHQRPEIQADVASHREIETQKGYATPQEFARQQYRQLREKPPDYLLFGPEDSQYYQESQEAPIPKQPYQLQVTPEEYQQVQQFAASKKPNTGKKYGE